MDDHETAVQYTKLLMGVIAMIVLVKIGLDIHAIMKAVVK